MSLKLPLGLGKSHNSLSFLILFYIWLVSLALSLSADNQSAMRQYDLSGTELHILQVIFALPNLFIWGTLLFTILSIRRYCRQVGAASEAQAFRYIHIALSFLLVGYIVSNYISALQALVRQAINDPTLFNVGVAILTNYVSVILALLVYGYLFAGSQTLLASLNRRLELSPKQAVIITATLVTLGAAYLTSIFANPYRQVAASSDLRPTFGISDPLIVLTVALPLLVSWLLGLLAIWGFYRYKALAGGVIYRLFFVKFTRGLAVLIALTIALQFLVQSTTFLRDTGLSVIVGLITLIFLILIAAHVQIASSTSHLLDIEMIASGKFTPKPLKPRLGVRRKAKFESESESKASAT